MIGNSCLLRQQSMTDNSCLFSGSSGGDLCVCEYLHPLLTKGIHLVLEW